MATLICKINETELLVNANPVRSGLLSVDLDGEEVGTVERLARESYKNSAGFGFPTQVEAIRNLVKIHKAKNFIC